jgi:error-prone DNA polymerase
MVALAPLSSWEQMALEYRTLGLYPSGHLMEKLRPLLGKDVMSSEKLREMRDGQKVRVAGMVARPLQHPLANAYFITLEDEHGFIPLIIWTNVYEKYRDKLREPLLLVEGVVSRREGTLNVVVNSASVPRLERIPTGDIRRATEFVKLPRPMFR